MTEMFRIIGKNDIHFDAGTTSNYLFSQGKPPRKMTTILTRRELLSILPRLPLGIRPMALKHGLSVITMELNIQGTDDADMEAKEHALIETLVETDVYFSNGGMVGTKAELQVKSDGASEVSFKSVFYGVVDELDARDVLGAVIKAHRLEGLRLTLYCEPYWRPGTFNHLFNGGFEHWDRVPYGGAGTDTEPDGWEDYTSIAAGGGTNNRNAVTVQQGIYATMINAAAINAADYQGIRENIFGELIAGVTYTLIVWIQNATITNGVVQVYIDTDVSADVYARNSAVANAAYTRYTVAFSLHEDDTNAYVTCRILGNVNGCNGTLYVDGMMVVRGTLIPSDFIEWHPNPGIRIGPNLLSNADFEEWHTGTVNSQPDCWDDYEWQPGNMTGEVNNREDVDVLQGCYALEILMTGSIGAGEKGVSQSIRARVVDDTEYVLIGWIKNTAIAAGQVRFYVTGTNFGSIAAYWNTAANDQYTRYAVTFTPTAADAAIFVRAMLRSLGAGCSGTAYFDKIMVIRADEANGHSFVPEEWTGCGYVANHYDSECGDVPYLDMVDTRGDVEAPLDLKVERLSAGETAKFAIGRRSEYHIYGQGHRQMPCAWTYWFEFEDAAIQNNWPDVGDVNCSNANKVCDTANVSGHVQWFLTTAESDNLVGRFRIWVRAETDDIANTKLRARIYVGATTEFETTGEWVYLETAGLNGTQYWMRVDMGSFRFPSDVPTDRVYIRVEYEKDAGIRLCADCMLLMPDDEYIVEYSNPDGESISGYPLFDFKDYQTLDFPTNGKYYSTLWRNFIVKHGGLKLSPEIQQRLFVNWLGYTAGPIYEWRVEAAGDSYMSLMTLEYLPQFVSPLE